MDLDEDCYSVFIFSSLVQFSECFYNIYSYVGHSLLCGKQFRAGPQNITFFTEKQDLRHQSEITQAPGYEVV